MKKLKLDVDHLEVSTFVAEERIGTVYALEGTESRGPDPTCVTQCNPSYYQTQCLCTDADGCYASLYCSQAGAYNTCAGGCLTNKFGEC